MSTMKQIIAWTTLVAWAFMVIGIGCEMKEEFIGFMAIIGFLASIWGSILLLVLKK